MIKNNDRIIAGWLDNIEKHPSPHYNQRPLDTVIDLLVIHCISLPPGKFGSNDINAFFGGKLNVAADPFFSQIEGLKVSAHCLIRRDGQVIQYVSFEHRAWHAGLSTFAGRKNCNDFSIGIEMEGTDDTLYTAAQYTALVGLTKTIITQYPNITERNIVGHSDIAPGRKTDPGPGFDWQHYFTRLHGTTKESL